MYFLEIFLSRFETNRARMSSTLKRQNTGDLQASPKRQKSEENEEDDAAEENRAAWIQEQLDALQVKAIQS